MPGTKAKLSKHFGHHGIPIIPHNKGGTSQCGFGVQWQAEPNDIAA